MAAKKRREAAPGSVHTEGEKWIAAITKVDRELVEKMESMQNDELKQRVLQSSMSLIENDRKRVADLALHDAKVEYENRKGPYDDVKKFQNAIVQYGVLLLEERGVDLTGGDHDE